MELQVVTQRVTNTFFKYIIISMLLMFLSCSKERQESPLGFNSHTTFEIHGLTQDTHTVALQIMDVFGHAFYKKKSMNSKNKHTFDYLKYRTIVGQLIIDGKESHILIEPNKDEYAFEIDSLGYLKNNNIIEEYINDNSYLIGSDCAYEKSLERCILCVDEYIENKQKLLEDYRRKGMTGEFYNLEITDLYYERYRLYGQIAVNRRGAQGINEDNSVIKDLMSSMDMEYGLFLKSSKRVQAVTFHSVLNRTTKDDVKKYNYNNFRKIYHESGKEPMLSTHLLAYLYDNPYKNQAFIDSLKESSIAEFVEFLDNKNSVGKKYDIKNAFWVDKDSVLVEDDLLDNKVSLVNFWFPGCKPCIETIPQKNKLVEHYSNDARFQLLNVNCKSDIGLWKEYLRRYEMQGVHFYVKRDLQNKHKEYYELNSFPTYMLILNNKIIRIEQYPVGSKEFHQVIDSALDNLNMDD